MVKPKNCPNTWYNMMRACWMYDARDRPCFWQIVDYLRDVTNDDFQKKSFVCNEMSEKRPEPPYAFDRQWPPMEEATSQEGSIDELQEPAPPEKPSNEDDDSASSCSCSECSGDEGHSGLKYMDPMQKHNIRNYLDSVKNSGAGLNSMSAGKAHARDTDRLLDDSDEEDFPNNRSNTTSTYLTHSSPSTSRMGGQPRRTIDSDDKQAIRKAILAAQTKSSTQQWLNENNDDADPTDYLMTIAPAKPQDEDEDQRRTTRTRAGAR
ncbi:hypothetical protein M3Y97_00798800 [Aphelenchoides bicaudatus]|nr:hypothetical protein M3Y97_00798800 [Aphelenchoides bicaudatus]